ncbi:hypothetical protein MIDIC_230075 [Alphaproteobacteria bacterium]
MDGIKRKLSKYWAVSGNICAQKLPQSRLVSKKGKFFIECKLRCYTNLFFYCNKTGAVLVGSIWYKLHL